MEQSTLTPEQRRDILDRAVAKYVKQGYRVISRTDTTAQLVKPKRFGCTWLLLSLLSLGIALVFYLYTKDKAIYLEVTPTGRIKRR